ncbi:hypothetical protein L917_02229 [Phytophthora nicotianae]|uniref:Uncharacterized protein n=1 Tax=Phytophthora nicotianae TaxID=4792 RepID=W2HHN7_PHYNI|nr:hypothetical protein L915_02339 [Phytophthora nicotianae]ETM01146.1 hypothetical protein L917_02229 [Phytophthora nicotianae]
MVGLAVTDRISQWLDRGMDRRTIGYQHLSTGEASILNRH